MEWMAPLLPASWPALGCMVMLGPNTWMRVSSGLRYWVTPINLGLLLTAGRFSGSEGGIHFRRPERARLRKPACLRPLGAHGHRDCFALFVFALSRTQAYP